MDETGLGSSPKLSRDAGSTPVVTTGGNGTGGSNAAGGSGGSATGGTGTGGSPTTTGGTGGDQSGTGGLPATGGASGDTGGSMGAAGAAGAPVDATGGAGGAGATSGAGGAAGMAVQGTGGGAGAGGTKATGGTAGAAGAGGRGGTRCTSFNCMGCCDGTVCVSTPTAQQCGTRGAACTACPACQTCSTSGTCAIDPGSQWTIVAENAKVTMSPPLGDSWDPAHGDEGGTAPDLFCEYENPAYDVTPTTAGVTDTVTDVYSASWNETITPNGVTVSASALMAAKPAWRIWVGDQDCSSPNSCTSGQIACSYAQPITAAQLMTGGLSISNYQNCVSLNLLLQCASPTP